MHFSEDMLSNFDFLSDEQKIVFIRALWQRPISILIMMSSNI